MTLVPGLAGGVSGLIVRYPAVLVLSFAALGQAPRAELPPDLAIMTVQIASEFLLGSLIALVPTMIISGVQTGGQLASTAMGLQPSQLIDPTTQAPLPDLSKIFGDLVVIMFLISDGHHAVLYAVSGMGGEIVPGTFLLGLSSLDVLAQRSFRIFELAVMIAAPVIVALLLTNFVLGLVTKAVPTVNVFIVSFPLTISIGLLLSMVAVPELAHLLPNEFRGLESDLLTIAEDTQRIKQ